MEWIAQLLPKHVRAPLAIVALVILAVLGAFQGFFILEAHAAETAEKTVKATVNTEVIAQLRTEAKNVAVEAAKEAAREAIKEVSKDAAADREFMMRKQAEFEVRLKEAEKKAAAAKK
jgi:hypothetical protein